MMMLVAATLLCGLPLSAMATDASAGTSSDAPDAAAASLVVSSGASTTSTTTPRYHFDESGTLKLDGKPVKVYFFADATDMPWFQAKPIHNFLGATKIGHTMVRVFDEHKSSLRGLLETKGAPVRDGSNTPSSPLPTLENVGYHDSKEYFVSESGLYQIIFGSDKPEAKVFTSWVTSVALPTLRRTGMYSTCCNGSVPALSSTSVQRRSHESTLSWTIELGVERKELRGVKAVFQCLLEIEVSAGALAPIDKSTLRRFMSAPPRRFEEFARAALKQFRQWLRARLDAVVVTGQSTSSAKRKQPHHSQCDDHQRQKQESWRQIRAFT